MSYEYNLDRDTYRAIKKMDRTQLERLLGTVYVSGKNEGREEVSNESQSLDLNALKGEISKIKGIGENRLSEIMETIENYISKEKQRS